MFCASWAVTRWLLPGGEPVGPSLVEIPFALAGGLLLNLLVRNEVEAWDGRAAERQPPDPEA